MITDVNSYREIVIIGILGIINRIGIISIKDIINIKGTFSTQCGVVDDLAVQYQVIIGRSHDNNFLLLNYCFQ